MPTPGFGRSATSPAVEQELPDQAILGASYGAALLAAIGTGLAGPDSDWTRTSRTVVPSREPRELYDQLAELYGRLYRDTAEVVHRLAALGAVEHASSDS